MIHFYPHKKAHLKSFCGLKWDEIKEHTAEIKYVTCKKCLNQLSLKLDYEKRRSN